MNNTNVKIELTVDEVKGIMRKAVHEINNKGYKPGQRREDIWGLFWALLDKRLGRETTLEEYYAYGDLPGVEELMLSSD